MYQTDQPTAVAALPAPSAARTPGFFTNGSPSGGQPATILDADFVNMLMLELVNVVLAGGLTPSKTVYTQVRDAIRAFVGPGRLLGFQPFTATAPYVPGVYGGVPATKARVRAIGGGGAGGGARATNASQFGIGVGGNAGTYAEIWIGAGLAPLQVTIGAGGVPAAGANGGDGGATSFGGLLLCPGGRGGFTEGPTAPPFVFANQNVGTVASGTGTIIFNAPGPCAQAPVIALALNMLFSGAGASSMIGCGGLGQGGTVNGGNASGSGAGGGGSATGPSAAATAGGAGSPGFLLIEEYA